MASRFITCLRPLSQSRLLPITKPVRPFSSAARLLDATVTTASAPVRKPVGAFRGGIFGFLLGSVVSGALTFYYVLEEYRVSNELLTEDIYALQAAVQRIHTYVSSLEEKVGELEKKKGKS